MEPWLTITLIVAGIIALAVVAWLLVAIFSIRAFRKTTQYLDQSMDEFHRNHFRNH